MLTKSCRSRELAYFYSRISGVINDETKRLSFLVEKVLQMSLFERQKAALKLKEIDANDLVANVANTFVLINI